MNDMNDEHVDAEFTNIALGDFADFGGRKRRFQFIRHHKYWRRRSAQQR